MLKWACFAAQQDAEKAVKAVFQLMGAIAWGHSVYELLRVLSKKIDVPEDVLNCGRALDKYYILTRYPNGFEKGSPLRVLYGGGCEKCHPLLSKSH